MSWSRARIRRWTRGLLIGLVTGMCGAIVASTTVGSLFERNVGLAWMFKIRGTIEPPSGVVLVAIDGTTGPALNLPKLPRDWPRTMHARLVDSLVARGASVIVFDLHFGRPGSADEDSVFAGAVARSGRVVLFERLDSKRQLMRRPNGGGPAGTWIEEKLIGPSAQLAAAARALAPFPLPKIESATFEFWTFKSSLGEVPTTAAAALQLHALSVYDRWLAILRGAGAQGIDSLPSRAEQIQSPADLKALMITFRHIFDDSPVLVDALQKKVAYQGPGHDRQLLLATLSLYATSENRYLNFYGPPGTIRRIPYEALVGNGRTAGEQAIGDLANAVVFVGYSDLVVPDQPDGIYTVFTTSNEIDLAGVEIMATAFANLLTDRSLRPTGHVLSTLIHLSFGFILGASVYLLPAWWSVPLALLASCAYGTGVQWGFARTDVWLPLAVPVLLQLPLALLLGLMGQYLLERQRERRMRSAVGYYLPPSAMVELVERQIDPTSISQASYGICLATDMAGFSSIAEKKPPQDIAAFMNSYFDALAQPLKRHGVDITEFRADAIMCAWVAKEADRGVRANAVRAAVGVVDAVQSFCARNGSIHLSPRVGLQDGNIYVGHTGGGGRMVYSIVGDTANTAARLESLNKHLGTRVLAANSVVLDVDDLVQRFLGYFCLAGKADAIPVVEVLATRSAAMSSEQLLLCERFAQALQIFHARCWLEAADQFQAILERHPHDGPSRFYLMRCRRNVGNDADVDDARLIRMDVK